MGNILPPPSTGVPAIIKGGEDFTPVWRQWFVKLAEIINRSGGAGGSVPATRIFDTVHPLIGGGDLSVDRLLSIDLPGVSNDVLKKSGSTMGSITGITVVVTTAKLTPGGANGSMTFTHGVLTAQTQAT
jgi:hypothetical protein